MDKLNIALIDLLRALDKLEVSTNKVREKLQGLCDDGNLKATIGSIQTYKALRHFGEVKPFGSEYNKQNINNPNNKF